ncbi:MAG: type IX secretion system protein PorQ [Bacteroidetes bacterium]|nr:type IX secretion system protein PorQ [Bacteroidota bacterium]
MKKIFFLLFFFFAFILLSEVETFAQIGGSKVYEFLNLSVPARVAALGGTVISAKDNDLNLSFQNPSLLDSTVHNQLSMSYIDYFTDIRYGYAAYARSYRKAGSFSAGMQFLNYGTFTSANQYGEINGQFKAADYSLNLSYARPLDSVFSIGGTVKTIYSKFAEYTSYGNALDVAVTYFKKKEQFCSALVIKNIGKQWKPYFISHEPLPFEIQWGFSQKVRHAPFRLNFTFAHLEKWDLTYVDPSVPTTDPITGAPIKKSKASKFADKLGRHVIFGTEVLLTHNFHLLVGYNYMRRQELKLESHPGIAGFSFGFGLKILRFHLSYAYSKFHAAGGPNHFTISTNLSEFYSRK